MTWILQIDTALDTAVASISKDGLHIGEKVNYSQKDHASFLHGAIRDLVLEAGISLKQLNAIALVAGPGSYTGLRVGFATAKGLCFALKIPLIAIGTLHLMAASALAQLKEIHNYGTMLVCPLIDARRMEVYTALYNSEMEIKLIPQALILNHNSWDSWLLNNKIYFFGTGVEKWKTQCKSENAVFPELNNNNLVFSKLAYSNYQQNIFESVAYCEPFYLKEFYSTGV